MLQSASILNLFFSNHTEKSSAESFIDHTYRSTGKKLKGEVRTGLPAYLGGLTDRDDVNITVIPETGQFTFESIKTDADNQAFFEKWDQLVKDTGAAEGIDVTIVIRKKAHQGRALFIYDIAAFLDNLVSLSSTDLIQAFSGVFRKTGSHAYFIWPDERHYFETKTVHFAKDLQSIPAPDESIERVKLWEKLKSICHLSGIENCIALPEDFEIIKTGTLSAETQQRFKECIQIMSMAILCDMTTVTDEELILKLNGYKSFEIKRTLDPFDITDLPEYYRIYNWLVTGGGIQDKTGLARNLISLNLGDAPGYKIAGTAYNSIQSGYKVYERQNIKQYIELRNKMADQIISFNEKATKIVDGFAGSFQKSTLAVVSLYATLIISKVLSSSNIVGAFSLGATILSYVFLIISLVYFFMSRKEVRGDRQRLIDAYNRMKIRNEDLLEKEDIKLILREDADHTADLNYMTEKVKWYTTLWIILISLFAVATMVLYVINLNS